MQPWSAPRVRFRDGVLLPNAEGFGDRAVSPPHNFFLNFRSQSGQIWCILHAIFYSSADCFARIITELMVLKGEAAA